MKAMSGREFARLIERHGWQLLRVSGSHHIYGKAGSPLRLSIPIHANRPLKLDCCAIWPSMPAFRRKKLIDGGEALGGRSKALVILATSPYRAGTTHVRARIGRKGGVLPA